MMSLDEWMNEWIDGNIRILVIERMLRFNKSDLFMINDFACDKFCKQTPASWVFQSYNRGSFMNDVK